MNALERGMTQRIKNLNAQIADLQCRLDAVRKTMRLLVETLDNQIHGDGESCTEGVGAVDDARSLLDAEDRRVVEDKAKEQGAS